jgi:hypothetical protein
MMRPFETLGSLKFFDMLAPQITLRFAGHQGIRTIFGVALTVGYFFSIAAFAYFIIQTYLNTDAPTVIREDSDEPSNPKVHLGDHNLLPVAFLYMDEILNVPAENANKYFTLRFTKLKFRTTYLANGTTSIKMSKYEMPVIPCSQLRNNETAYSYYKEYEPDPLFKKLGQQYGLCARIDPNEAYVAGMGTETDLDMMILQAMPCSLPTGCATISEVKRISFILASPTASLNMSNYESPKKSVLSLDNVFFVNEGLKQKYQPKVMTSEMYDDWQSVSNRIQGKSLRVKFHHIDRSMTTSNIRGRDPLQTTCTPFQVETMQCIAYLQIEYVSSNKKIKIVRVYKSMTKTLSEIGGINSFLFLLFYYLNFAYCQYARKKIMVTSVFEFFREEEAEVRKRNGDKKDKPAPSSNLDGSKIEPSVGGGGDQDLHDVFFKHANLSEMNKLKRDAYSIIENNIDVVTIIKEITQLKILLHLLFKDHHLKLAPLLAFMIESKNMDYKDKKRRGLIDPGAPNRPNDSMVPGDSTLDPVLHHRYPQSNLELPVISLHSEDDLTYRAALASFRREMMENQGLDEDGLDSKVSNFFAKGLCLNTPIKELQSPGVHSQRSPTSFKRNMVGPKNGLTLNSTNGAQPSKFLINSNLESPRLRPQQVATTISVPQGNTLSPNIFPQQTVSGPLMRADQSPKYH